jgi:pimeloyl-[acyl-carrier protein] methyl ester esterase
VKGGLHVESAGAGSPLVLLHGWAMHAGVWGPLPAHLAARRRVHCVDLPGHGYSAPIVPLTLDAVVAALEASFADEPEPLAVLGWSLGGMVALRWARLHPARIGRLVLVCTTPRFVAGAQWTHGIAEETLRRFGDELRVAWEETVQRFLALQVAGSERGRAVLATLRHHVFARGVPSKDALAAGLSLLMAADLRAEVAAVRQPALVIAGAGDALTPPDAGRWLAATLPNARFAAIDGAGHAPFLSHPDVFDDAVDAFFDER